MVKKRSRTRRVPKKSIIIKKKQLSKKRSKKRTSRKTQEGGFSLLGGLGVGVVLISLLALITRLVKSRNRREIIQTVNSTPISENISSDTKLRKQAELHNATLDQILGIKK
jgi:hypothetical protein